jgi:quercetin dioxygenase-like cupin family protein
VLNLDRKISVKKSARIRVHPWLKFPSPSPMKLPLKALSLSNGRQLLHFLLTGVACFAAGAAVESAVRATPDLASRIWRVADARKGGGDWGTIYTYTSEGTATVGTDSVLTAELEFLPGKQLQPPHVHANEEFQYVIEGGGTWFLNGKETPIQKGDLMYAKPGDLHGISNTTDKPLRFFVFKWISKGGPKTLPQEPPPAVPVSPAN